MKTQNAIKLLSFLLFAIVVCNNFAAFGQRKRQAPEPAANQPSTSNKKTVCNGGWTGVVTYRKRLIDSLTSDEPGIRKEKDRIKHKSSRNYDYNARAIVDGSNPPNAVVNVNVDFSDKNLNWGEERVWDTCNSRENGHWFIIEGTDNQITEAKATGAARSFNLNVDELNGYYNFSLVFPDANGKYNREEHTQRSGHCQPQNNEPFDRTTKEKTKIDGESFSVNGEKLDPRKPDTITGSKSWGGGTGAVKGFYYEVSWRFTRCPTKLLITDLKFEDMKFPNWNDWQEISEYSHTTDGNWVRIKAKILNMSLESKFAEIRFVETFEGDRYNGSFKDAPLKDSSVSVRLEGGEEREVEILWDSQGYAWFDDGRPRNMQRIKAEAREEDKLKDAMTKNLQIAPKPLILVPGIWTNPNHFDLYQNILTVSHGSNWKAERVVYTSAQEKKENRSVYDNADNLTRFINNVRTSNNAWHIDMLAHSTGGLIARLYVHKQEILPDSYPVVKHLMMLGTPNNGVPCADAMGNNDAFKNNMKTAQELMPTEIALFNQYVIERKGTKFSALIGNSFPTLCASFVWNDGFVSVDSAKFGISDFAFTKAMQPDLVSPKSFNDFVKPHVVTGPGGTYPLSVISEPGGSDGRVVSGN